MQPEEPAYQDYNEEDDDQGYFEGDYFTTEADLEIERLKRLLAKKDQVNQDLTHQLAGAKKKQAGRPKKKKSQSTRRNETEVTETATVYTEAQTRTGPMTRQQAARAAGDTRNQATSAQVPQGPRQPPSPIRHPPSPIRHPEQPRNDPIPPANTGRGSRSNRAFEQDQGNNANRPYSNQQNRPAANQAQPRQHNMQPPRMNNDGYRPPQQGHYRANSYREASVGSSQSASSR